MIKQTLILLFLFVTFKSHGQNVIIKGKIVDFDSLQNVMGCTIEFDTKKTFKTKGKLDGSFELSFPKNHSTKRNCLTIRSLGFVPLRIINIPLNDSVVDLGVLTLPTYIRYDNFEKVLVKRNGKYHYSKRKTRLEHRKKKMENEKLNETKFEMFTFRFGKNDYKLNFKNNTINLSKPCRH